MTVGIAVIFIVGKADAWVLLPSLHETGDSANTLHFVARSVREERYCGAEERMKEQGFDEECRQLYEEK